ncbi:uncharacterized protein TNCV_3440971 [Trichonephila clavipes]|uniref:Mutator-like transposase domain-containing protein n=1 Tax=Trichonephila clavipes TaxID=2585209 RepID=A0A8X6W5N3_TRICX|nr:uncharacterized protein TNCV_3440971 [Trichonephila clavipes]
MRANPYNGRVEKLECIRRMQMCMSTRLLHLNDKNREKKFSGGKSLKYCKRLTEILVSTIQKYYCMAIRNNINDLHSLKNAVWAVYFLSSNESPQHGLCPAGVNSWCKFQKAEAECNQKHYEHKHIRTCSVPGVAKLLDSPSHFSKFEIFLSEKYKKKVICSKGIYVCQTPVQESQDAEPIVNPTNSGAENFSDGATCVIGIKRSSQEEDIKATKLVKKPDSEKLVQESSNGAKTTTIIDFPENVSLRDILDGIDLDRFFVKFCKRFHDGSILMFFEKIMKL